MSDALAALNIGRALKIPEDKILAALSGYEGIWRRMEYRGELPETEISLFDDYAHHPSEIKATLSAFKKAYPERKLICVFQPHQAKRLTALFKEFLTAFVSADSLLLLPIYRVAGRDEEKTKYTSERLALELRKKYSRREIIYLTGEEGLEEALLSASGGKPSVAVMMGAGNISDYTDELLS